MNLLWTLIEAPRPICAQRFETAEQASRCVKWLEIQGFEVLYVQKGRASPLIIIRPNPLCDKLEGAVAVYERGQRFERRYKMVTRLHCEVRWDDTAGGAQ